MLRESASTGCAVCSTAVSGSTGADTDASVSVGGDAWVAGGVPCSTTEGTASAAGTSGVADVISGCDAGEGGALSTAGAAAAGAGAAAGCGALSTAGVAEAVAGAGAGVAAGAGGGVLSTTGAAGAGAGAGSGTLSTTGAAGAATGAGSGTLSTTGAAGAATGAGIEGDTGIVCKPVGSLIVSSSHKVGSGSFRLAVTSPANKEPRLGCLPEITSGYFHREFTLGFPEMEVRSAAERSFRPAGGVGPPR